MVKLLMVIISCILLFGCRTNKVATNQNIDSKSESKLDSMKYDPITKSYIPDMLDIYMDLVYAGKVVFDPLKASILYLITSVEIFNARPDEEFKEENVAISIIIFRWRF